MRALLPSLALLLAALPVRGLTPADRVVPLSAGWQASPAALTLAWPTGGQAVAWTVQRKPLLQPGWTTLAVLTNPAATAYTDATATAGAAFEYKVTRQDAVTNAWGFLYGGFNLPPAADRGALLLVVESNAAALLAPELARFEYDLAGDGWRPVRLTAPRKNWNDSGWAASVTNLKARILDACQADPAIGAVLLFGHVPVPYSGIIAPDGHYDHVGAWPADGYYGDLDGTWTDLLSSPTNGERLVNRPGDGKFDPSEYFEYSSELMVGRVDLGSLPAFAQPEIELLRQYLAKNHQYRHGRLNAPARGLIRDSFGYFPLSGEAFAQNAIRDFGTWFGPSQVVADAFFPNLRTNAFLAAYGCGSGNMTGAGGVGSTPDFATGAVHAVFTMLFGSYFGDWDTTNNFLRAPLASTPWALTSVWAGRPKWNGHPMDLGEPIGRVFQLLQGGGYLDYEDELPTAGVHEALMGDPTLRLHVPPPPRQLAADWEGGQAVLSWQSPAGSGWRFLVSRAEAGSRAFTNLHAGLLDGLSYTGSLGGLTAAVFQVRAARLEGVRSGSYTNLSQGVFVRIDGAGNVNRPPVVTNRVAATLKGRPVAIPLAGSDPDGDPCFTGLTAWPATGSLTGSPDRLVYLPPPGFTGTVQFAYEASDGLHDSSNALVNVTVAPTQTVRGTSCDWLIRTIGYAADYGVAEELDHDGDGLPTWAEYRAGTDPRNAQSVFAILSLALLDGSNKLTWYATTNSGVVSKMAIKRGTNLPAVNWPWAASNLARHPSGTNSWLDTNPPPRAFYRVVIP
jgi:hypothetical protein